MSDTDTQAPARTAADAIADLDSIVAASRAQAIPFSLTHAVELLLEHAKLAPTAPAAVDQALVDRVEAVELLLVESGITPAPAAPAAPGPAL